MDKRKKGFLNASSIITIVIASLSILMSCLFFFGATLISEDFVIDLYKSDPTATYVEHADGGYEIIFVDDGEQVSIDDETLSPIIKIAKAIMVAFGIFGLGFAIAQMVLSIKILQGTSKGVYKKGCTIALLVLSVLNGSFLVTILLVVAMCSKENKPTENDENKQEDIVLKDI